jgi:hypothetical protein
MPGIGQRYMPYHGTLPAEICLDSPKCLVLEIPSSVFVPGSKTWDNVLEISEYQDIFRLFLYTLEVCVFLQIGFMIETLIPVLYVEGVPKRPAGYRLWVALSSDNAFDVQKMTSSLDSGRAGPKKRKVDDVDRHLKPVETQQELNALLKTYNRASESEFMFLDVLSHHKNFEKKRTLVLHPSQEVATGYFTDGNLTPSEFLIENGLFQYHAVGSLLVESATEILTYTLPLIVPPASQLKSKYDRMLNSSNTEDPTVGMSEHDRIEHYNKNVDFTSVGYTRTTHDTGTLDHTIDDNYFIVRSLSAQNKPDVDALKTDADTEIIYSRIATDITTIISTPFTRGVPSRFNAMSMESKTTKELPANRKFWDQHRADYTGKFTRCSHGLLWMALASSRCLGLLRTQQIGFMPVWLRLFSVLRLNTQVSMTAVFIGGNATGKSELVGELMACVPITIQRQSDSKSSLSDPQSGTKNDMTVVGIDEYPYTSKHHGLLQEQTRMTKGVLTHTRVERDPITHIHGNVTYNALLRYVVISSTNEPDKIPKSIANRVTFIPLPSEAGTTAIKRAIASKRNPIKVEYKKTWQSCLRGLSSTQYAYAMADATSGLPEIDMRCFELFWNMLEVEVGISDIPTRKAEDMCELSICIMIWNNIRTWHVDGLGAHYGYDLKTELIWYAYRRYVRMEDICTAYMYQEMTRSIKHHVLDIMRTIKAAISMTDGELVVTKGKFWELTYRSREVLYSRVKTKHELLGDGICTTVLNSMFINTTDGVPNLQVIERDKNPLLIANKMWLSTATTCAEAAIMRYLYRLTTGTTTSLDFETESIHIYKTNIRHMLSDPSVHDSKHTELHGMQASTIKRAMAILSCRCIPGTEIPYIQKATSVVVMEHHETATRGGIPCLTIPGYKIKTDQIMVLCVDKRFFDDDKIAECETPVDKFIKNAYVIAGGYGGKHVVSGIPNIATGKSELENAYYIDPDATVSITVDNAAHFKTTEWGPDTNTRDTIFPSTPTYTVNEGTNFQGRVEAECHARVPLSPEMKEMFSKYCV